MIRGFSRYTNIVIGTVAVVIILTYLSSQVAKLDMNAENIIYNTDHEFELIKHTRLSDYCSRRTPYGDEGKHIDSRRFKLVSLVLTIRHGDRSSIHGLPNSTMTQYETSKVERSPYLWEPHIAPYLSLSKYFKISEIFNTISISTPPPKPEKKRDKSSNKIRKKDTNTNTPTNNIDNTKFIQALNSIHLFTRSDNKLPQGELTSIGYLQHLQLGEHLAKAYAYFLNDLKISQVYIRSTNYHRTIQSVTALVSTFLLPYTKKLRVTSFTSHTTTSTSDTTSTTQSLRSSSTSSSSSTTIPMNLSTTTTTSSSSSSSYTIHVHPREQDEIMHGIGLKLSSHHIDDKGELHIDGSCQRSANEAQKQKQAYIIHPEIRQELNHLFGDKVQNKVMTDVVDSILPQYCHHEKLPCSTLSDKIHNYIRNTGSSSSSSSSSKSYHTCVNDKLLLEMMHEADQVFCDRYIGSKGGWDATKLSIYPFMLEILQNLKLSMDTYSGSNTTTATTSSTTMSTSSSSYHSSSFSTATTNNTSNIGKSNRKVTIFSGHDTVIAPILAILGVYKQFCVWPPLASRIVFELYKYIPENTSNSNNIHKNDLLSISAGITRHRQLTSSSSSSTRRNYVNSSYSHNDDSIDNGELDRGNQIHQMSRRRRRHRKLLSSTTMDESLLLSASSLSTLTSSKLRGVKSKLSKQTTSKATTSESSTIYTATTTSTASTSIYSNMNDISGTIDVNYYVRILYNGKDIALYIPECQSYYLSQKRLFQETETVKKTGQNVSTAAGGLDTSSSLSTQETVLHPPILCPFTILESRILHVLSPHTTIDNACKV